MIRVASNADKLQAVKKELKYFPMVGTSVYRPATSSRDVEWRRESKSMDLEVTGLLYLDTNSLERGSRPPLQI
jgi:hypothetical protein